jgi:hypothetical protein
MPGLYVLAGILAGFVAAPFVQDTFLHPYHFLTLTVAGFSLAVGLPAALVERAWIRVLGTMALSALNLKVAYGLAAVLLTGRLDQGTLRLDWQEAVGLTVFLVPLALLHHAAVERRRFSTPLASIGVAVLFIVTQVMACRAADVLEVFLRTGGLPLGIWEINSDLLAGALTALATFAALTTSRWLLPKKPPEAAEYEGSKAVT